MRGGSFLLVALLVPPTSPALRAQAPPDPQQDVRRLEARPLKGLKADVAALLLSGREIGVLRALILAAPVPGGETDSNVAVWVEIDGASLFAEAEESTEAGDAPEDLRLEIHTYAMRSSGGLAASLSEMVRLPLDELGEELRTGGVKYSGALHLEPGVYTIRVMVRERRSQRFIVRNLDLDVPAADTAAAFLSPPFFADLPGAWIEAGGGGASGGSSRPSVLPVLPAGREVAAQVWHQGPEADVPRLEARLLDRERKPSSEIGLRFSEPKRPPEGRSPPMGRKGRLRSFDLRFALPEDVKTGNYFLETTVQGGRARSTLPVYVLGPEREERGLVWTDIQRLSSSRRDHREALELAAKRRSSKRIAAIAAAYRETLNVLVSGAVEAAVEELRKLEAEVVESDENDARAWLRSAQHQVIVKLAEVEAESLVPLLHLHMENHERYLSEGQRSLTFFARERLVETARLYAERSDSPMASTMASATLADIGVLLRRSGMNVGARRLMEEAIALNGKNTVALEMLALEHERQGEYKEATVYLRRLLKSDRQSEEGRLRLALCLRRIGDNSSAARHLRRLIDGGDTDWLLAMAYQELAQILLYQERFDESVRVLEAGVRRLPSVGRLRIQLAYALDRAGEGRRGREILDGIKAVGGSSPEPSPRLLYSRLPKSQAQTHRPELVRHSMARLVFLAQALGKSTGK